MPLPTPKAPRLDKKSSPSVKILTGREVVKDMRQFRQEVTSSPEAARAFLMSLGVLTSDGKRKNLIRG